jgi:predicted dehydrogenase
VQFSSVSGTEGTLYIENHGYFLYLAGKKRRIHLSPMRDWAGFTAMHAEFLRVVRARQSAMSAGEVSTAETEEVEMSGAEGRRALAFVLAAYRSFREGRAVEL